MDRFKVRSKTFVSMDSLWYEEERLATFIDWPVLCISATELAREGFYYLRTKDHCACAFCRGVIGKWEEGDTPRGEHKKHFPDCPFVQGKVTPNVPLKQGNILSKVTWEVTTDMNNPTGEDVCGTGKMEKIDPCLEIGLIKKSSNSKISLESLGFKQYCGPKRKEYLTTEVRLRTFKNWPERVTQKPADLADAGFYYCGLSDHVRCFHCGNGLRNWEPDDKPWEEHARWFPDCHFVTLKKGVEFVDKVRRENPPYYKKKPSVTMNETCASTSQKPHLNLSEDDMDKLMELHIMKHVLDMGFSEHFVKTALKNRLQESGQPFFSLRTCIDSILLIMEKETKNTIQGKEDVAMQAKKIASYERPTSTSGTPHSSSVDNISNVNVSNPLLTPSSLTSGPSTSPGVNIGVSYPPLPNNNIRTVLSTAPVASFPVLSRATPPLRSSTPTSPMELINTEENANADQRSGFFPSSNFQNFSHTFSTDVVGRSEQGPALNSANQDTENGLNSNHNTTELNESSQRSQDTLNQSTANQTTPLSNAIVLGEVVPMISEADVIMKEAAKLLSTPSTSSELSSTSTSESSSGSASDYLQDSGDVLGLEQSHSHNDRKDEAQSSSSQQKAPADVQENNVERELERIRDNRICKVCMDKEMDVVFLPCTHMVTCSSCAVALAACPICRREIQYAFKPIIS